MSDDNTRLVWSSEGGRVRDERPAAPPASGPGDGVVRVGRTSSGRRGKTVTVVTGLPPADVARVAKELKRLCGSGGSVKDGVVEIQGDQRAKVIAHLGGAYRVKPTGG
ncbi:stress response translation initiation inhibitor YciH [Miltoncostaea marina]|uniref:translation initiation factor n=1 Tax=Miltoncostaea marina TaxID=2843215 RepID=UPI0031BB8A04